MTRMLNIRAYDEDEGGDRVVGRFDLDKATRWECVKDWDGHNQVDVHTHDYATDTTLYRTAGGRWVLRTDSRWVDTPTSWEFTRPDLARDWLLVNGDDEAVTEHFGEDVTAEFGPEQRQALTPSLIASYRIVHAILDNQPIDVRYQLSRCYDYLATALRAVGSSGAEALDQ